MAASMAAVILASGQPGFRSTLEHSEVMIHQPFTSAEGQSSDIEIVASHIRKIREMLYKSLADASGMPMEKIAQDADRNYWMDANEAREYGIIEKLSQRNKYYGTVI